MHHFFTVFQRSMPPYPTSLPPPPPLLTVVPTASLLRLCIDNFTFFQQINLRALHSYLAHLIQISKICFNFQVLLDLARTIFEEQSTLHNIVQKIMMITQTLLQCERCSVLLVDPSSKVWVEVIHLKRYTYNFDAVYWRERRI